MERALRMLPPALLAALLALVLATAPARAQVLKLFGDSPDSTQWASSWGTATGGSALALVTPSHVPVQTAQAFLGANALRLAWTAASGGDWALTAAFANWTAYTTAPYDTLVFAVWSPVALSGGELPLVFLEDSNNARTPTHPMSAFVAQVPAAAWTRVAVPLAVFRAAPGAANLASVNKVFFGQSPTMTPGVARTLLVDEIRFVAAGLPPPAVPAIAALGFERHAEVRWDPAPLAGAEVVRVERAAGADWARVADVAPEDGAGIDWRGATGVAGDYRASTIGPDLRRSAPSATASATTRALGDEQWLDMTEEAAFRYFWLHAHPVSGMARERYGSGRVCTTGGTGMGIMATVAAVDRGWVTRADAVARVNRIADFYDTRPYSFHGVFSHWIEGSTGLSIPFDAPDDSTGDVVETSYLMMGLLSARRYFDGPGADEVHLRDVATRLWRNVEWDWYRPASPGTALYWLWSPKNGFANSFPLAGWNEAMIGYVLAKASPTHPIPATCYAHGWSRDGAMVNGSRFWGLTLWVGPNWGGGLYLNQYTFMALDPRFKRDAYANYEMQARNASLIDRLYCTYNPQGYVGYSSDIWGLTASDDPWGYSNRGPYQSDNGTLAPTAAIGMMPFTEQNSLAALKAMYRQYGSRLWGPFGFRDAFNPGQNWVASSYIAIDQGPITVMIENARTQLLWRMFMSNPEIGPALDSLGFVPDSSAVSAVDDRPAPGTRVAVTGASPNPFTASTAVAYALAESGTVEVTVHDVTGRRVATLWTGRQAAGRHLVTWDGRDASGRTAPAGLYLCRVRTAGLDAATRVLRLR